MKRNLINHLTYLLVWSIAKTLKIEFHNLQFRQQAQSLHEKGSYTLALWHEHLLGAIVAHAHMNMVPLASLSKDGDVVSFVLKKFGYQPVRGSSSRGGKEALQNLIRISNDGWPTAVTIDGPRGPRRMVKGGVVDISRKCQLAILPVSCQVKFKFVFWKSWDKFQLPLPFAKIHVVYGAPFIVAKDTKGVAFGEAKMRLKNALNTCENYAV